MIDTLLIGYGNIDREDDGAGWHIVSRVAARQGVEFPCDPSLECEAEGGGIHYLVTLQLIPEYAELIASARRVCFIDAHTGVYPQEIHIQDVRPVFQNSPLTHHMTPETCLSLAVELFGGRPEAILVSARGYRFGFSRSLSEETERAVNQAAEWISTWLRTPGYQVLRP